MSDCSSQVVSRWLVDKTNLKLEKINGKRTNTTFEIES